MKPRLVIVFYHPKDPKNVEDIARVSRSVGAELVIVPRPGGPRVDVEGVRAESLEEVRRDIRDCYRILLETYGFRYLDEAGVECSDCIALILGAEDYGVPRHVADHLEPHVVARIPMVVEGMSYNVASTAVMALYEIISRCGP